MCKGAVVVWWQKWHMCIGSVTSWESANYTQEFFLTVFTVFLPLQYINNYHLSPLIINRILIYLINLLVCFRKFHPVINVGADDQAHMLLYPKFSPNWLSLVSKSFSFSFSCQIFNLNLWNLCLWPYFDMLYVYST